MTALLKAADLTPEQFLDLMATLHQPDAAPPTRRIWLEAPDGWAFDWWLGLEGQLHWCGAGREPVVEPANTCLGRSTSGRLFARDGELRWRTITALGQSCWRTVFLGTTDWVGVTLDDHSTTCSPSTRTRSVFFCGASRPIGRRMSGSNCASRIAFAIRSRPIPAA